jgi:ABC-type transport system substrate-binding protein
MTSRSTKRFAVVVPLLLGALLGAGSARANASFTFEVSGTLVAKLYGESDYVFPWTGTVVIVLDTAADGTYGGADMVSFDMNSSGSSFHEPSFTFLPFEPYFTIVGGRLTHVDAEYDAPFEDDNTTSFTGLTVTHHQAIGHESPEVNGTAILTLVPEPAAAVMLLVGLAAGAGARRHQAGRAARRG